MPAAISITSVVSHILGYMLQNKLTSVFFSLMKWIYFMAASLFHKCMD